MTDTPEHPNKESLAALSLAALGVVFGDIGTSPIYAIRESLHTSHGVDVSVSSTLGVLSLIFWSLILVITIKYLGLVLRADNNGEGGIIALTALVMPRGEARGRRRLLVLLGLFGAALLYGDSMITPAISVLSAIEGLEVVTPVFTPYVIPITLGILVALFWFQRRGTAGVGAVFGPVTLVWFLTLAVLGIAQIIRNPQVMAALSPVYAVRFFAEHGMSGILVLGSVFLVVTGGEALYADIGHFGKKPIRLTWTFVVLPALVLNYFGQGALILRQPAAVEAPFYLMAPRWALVPLVGIATAATVIASQAVISGAFSLTRQAVQMGYLPRLRIEHTSPSQIGQVYLPAVNWGLMVACLLLVLGFGSSSRLASAYGVAVTTDMVFTTILFAVVAYMRLGWKLWSVLVVAGGFLLVDLSFWTANLHKIPSGGWFPLLVAATVFTVMTTWKTGTALVRARMDHRPMPFDAFIAAIEPNPPARVPGTAVFMTTSPEGVPRTLLHNLKHNKVLHERVILLTIDMQEIPRVRAAERAEVSDLGHGFLRVVARFGFMEDIAIRALLARLEHPGYRYDEMSTSFFFGEVIVVPEGSSTMPRWRAALYARLQRNAERASTYFGIPANRYVGLGAQVEI